MRGEEPRTEGDEMPRTLARETRPAILDRLKDPAGHFTARRRGDLAAHGVGAAAVAAGPGVPRKVAETHLRVLAAAGPLRTGRARWRTYCRRDEVRTAEAARMCEKGPVAR
ncbi:ArsR family transcriptional regulator [Streptomyces leeuwenhoekii]|uniref:ArsR family transcriptional regulator n=1 Tax=Streptomyces leeuwenhoekii TaxID=1437453 RepID=UPI0036A19284